MTAEIQMPHPPCAQHLGWTLLERDENAGRVRIGFTPRPEFLNPAGYVQGGFIAAMLEYATRSLNLGGDDFGPVSFAVSPITLPNGIEGVLGHDFLSRRVACIDYQRRELRVR